MLYSHILPGRPLVIQDVREFYAKQHENVSMSVRVHSYDALTNITWVKLGNETKTTIESDNKYGTSVSSDTVSVPFYTKHIALQGQCLKLNIKDVDVGDYTEYEVHIANSMGEVVVLLVVKQRGT